MKNVKYKKSTFDIGPLQIECVNVKCAKCNVYAHIGYDQKLTDIRCPVCREPMVDDTKSNCKYKNKLITKCKKLLEEL